MCTFTVNAQKFFVWVNGRQWVVVGTLTSPGGVGMMSGGGLDRWAGEVPADLDTPPPTAGYSSLSSLTYICVNKANTAPPPPVSSL